MITHLGWGPLTVLVRLLHEWQYRQEIAMIITKVIVTMLLTTLITICTLEVIPATTFIAIVEPLVLMLVIGLALERFIPQERKLWDDWLVNAHLFGGAIAGCFFQALDPGFVSVVAPFSLGAAAIIGLVYLIL